MLDLNDMTWMDIRQEHNLIQNDHSPRIDGAVSQDHLIVFHNLCGSLDSSRLCFLNLNKIEWSVFRIETLEEDSTFKRAQRNSLIYQNLFLSLTFEESDTDIKLLVAVVSLDHFVTRFTEEKYSRSLFLSQSKADITFKVENQLIPAHKQILIKKSQYFANLFTKLRQNVIEIKDCESDVFKNFLQFLYEQRFTYTNANQVIKLYILARKNLQEDLCEKCVNFLSQKIKENNIYEVFAFAHQENIQYLKNWCLKFLDKRNTMDVAKMIENFNYKGESYFKNYHKKFCNLLFSFVLGRMIYLKEKKSMQVCESFLFKNIEMETLPALARFLSEKNNIQENFQKTKKLKEEPERKTLLKEIREATYRFIHKNMETILASQTLDDFSRDLAFGSLFLSDIESDILFSVKYQLFLAHKQFIAKKSRYFDRVFNSGMAESRQYQIDIKDCDSDIFKEYLRFIYQGKIQIENENKAMELYIFADKHLQEDLCEQCVDFMNKTMKEDNVYKILDFAHERNVSKIINTCIEFFKNQLSIKNIAGLIRYLNRQEDLEFKENNKELRSLAFNFVLDYFFDISAKEKGKMQAYENFLIANIEMKNLRALVSFVSYPYQMVQNGRCNSSSKKNTPQTQDLFDEKTIRLKEAAFSFMHENVKIVMRNDISKTFLGDFLRDFTLYMAEQHAIQIQNKDNQIEMIKESCSEKNKGNGKKRMEPVQDGSVEEKPILKKGK